MFDQEFFPTPREVIEKMLAPYFVDGRYLPVMAVLEPSAGKGDIADFIQRRMHGDYRRRTDGIFCIELNPDLQNVLRGNGYSIVGDDFLRFTGEGMLFDLIVMNPPFSHGATHLLHAWDIMRDGDIVCILPSEMLRNPCTTERQLLAEVISDNGGSVEHIGPAFARAERRTDVEVCLIRLSKHADIGIDGLFDSARFGGAALDGQDAPIVSENQLACRDTVKRMADAYRATLASFQGAIKAMREMASYGREFGPHFTCDAGRHNATTRGVTEAFCKILIDGRLDTLDKDKFKSNYRRAFNAFAEATRAAAWSTVFERTDMARFMTKKVLEEFEKLQKGQRSVEFSEANVVALLDTLRANTGRIGESAIIEAFDLMTRYHEENRIHIEGWKTNDAWKVNRRFILPSLVDASCRPWHLNYYHAKDVDDIDRGLCMLEGIRFDQIRTIGTALQEAFREPLPGGSIVTSHFFEMRFYRKGTVHFLFRDADVWERFNVAACRGKKWLPMADVA